jgi:hypothetical protein
MIFGQDHMDPALFDAEALGNKPTHRFARFASFAVSGPRKP